uniref:Uncharacterized protein n=1 Tax=Anopheles melas TaxID=34690 RepID=A0A182U1M7_9DIPT
MREAFPSLPFDNITEEKLLLLLLLAARPSSTAQHEPQQRQQQQPHYHHYHQSPQHHQHHHRHDAKEDGRRHELTIIGEKIIINREGETIKQTLVDNDQPDQPPTVQKNAVLDTDDTAQSHAGHLPAAVLTAATAATAAAAAAGAATTAAAAAASSSPSVSSTTHHQQQQQHHHHHHYHLHHHQQHSVAASATATAAATFSTTAASTISGSSGGGGGSGASPALAATTTVPFSGELEELQNILHFPEEVALRITDMEYQLFYQVRSRRIRSHPCPFFSVYLRVFFHFPTTTALGSQHRVSEKERKREKVSECVFLSFTSSEAVQSLWKRSQYSTGLLKLTIIIIIIVGPASG